VVVRGCLLSLFFELVCLWLTFRGLLTVFTVDVIAVCLCYGLLRAIFGVQHDSSYDSHASEKYVGSHSLGGCVSAPYCCLYLCCFQVLAPMSKLFFTVFMPMR